MSRRAKRSRVPLAMALFAVVVAIAFTAGLNSFGRSGFERWRAGAPDGGSHSAEGQRPSMGVTGGTDSSEDAADAVRGVVSGFVRDVEGQSIGGATIRWRNAPEVQPASPGSARGPGSMLACDESGRFEIEVGSATVDIRATHPGFAAAFVPAASAGRVLTIVMQRGQEVSVRVITPDGAGIDGATVMLLPGRLQTVASVTRQSRRLDATTDDLGYCAFGTLAGFGEARVYAWHADWGATEGETIWLTGEAGVVHVIRFQRPAWVRGDVLDASTRTPLEGVTIVASEGGGRGVMTDASGVFALPLQPWQRKTSAYVIARKPDYADGTGVPAADGSTRIELFRGCTIRLRAVDGNGVPVPAARAILIGMPTGNRRLQSDRKSAVGDEMGVITIEGAQSGFAYMLSLQAPGGLAGSHDFDTVDLASEGSRDVGDVPLSLEGTVRVVLVRNGEPVPGESVYLFGAGVWDGRSRLRKETVRAYHGPRREAVSDSQGAVEFRQVPSGTFRVLVGSPKTLAVRKRTLPARSPGASPPREEIRVPLPGTRRLRVFVRGPRELASGSFDVRVLGNQRPLRSGSRVDAAAEFDRPQGFVVKRIEVRSLAFGASQVAGVLDVPNDDQDDYVVALGGAGRIEGVLLDADRQAIPGGEVEYSSADTGNGTVVANSDGGFVLHVQGGAEVTLAHRGWQQREGKRTWRAWQGSLTVVAGSAGLQSLACVSVSIDRTLGVRVLDDRGRAVPDARVRVQPTDAEAMTDAKGDARFDALPRAQLLLLIRPPRKTVVDIRLLPAVKSVKPSRDRVTISLETQQRVRGQVVELSGAAPAGALIELLRKGSVIAAARADAGGNFSVWLPGSAPHEILCRVRVAEEDDCVEAPFVHDGARGTLRLPARAR